VIYVDARYDSFRREISPSQRPLHTQGNTTQKDEDKYPYLKRNSNTRSQSRRYQGREATETGYIMHPTDVFADVTRHRG
jgi:hypothetical protein